MLFTWKNYYSNILLLFVVVVLLSGCAPMMVGGAAVGTVGYFASRDKGIGVSIDDSKIETVIQSKLYKISPDFFSNVSVSSNNGCVLLTGVVDKAEWLTIAEREAWSVKGVVAVDNNIVVGKTLGVKIIAEDAAITSQARVRLLINKNVRSANYKIKTVNRVMYLRGVSKSKKELDCVLNSLRRIKNLKKIVSYVNLDVR